MNTQGGIAATESAPVRHDAAEDLAYQPTMGRYENAPLTGQAAMTAKLLGSASVVRGAIASIIGGLLMVAATSTQLAATAVIEGLYCGTALSGGELVEVRTRLTTQTNGLLKGTYDFADLGETTSGTLEEKQRGSDLERTLTWTDKYGSGLAKFNFTANTGAFDGNWGVFEDEPTFRWDGKRCDDPTV